MTDVDVSRRGPDPDSVLTRCRPSAGRAAAAARLADAPADDSDVIERMRRAAHRSRQSAGPDEPPRRMAAASAGATALATAPSPRRAPDAPVEPQPRHLQVVPEPGLTAAQRRRRTRALLIGGIGSGAAIGLALVYFHVVLAQRQFTLDRLNTQVQQAQTTYQADRLQVAQLSSPQHIITMAEGQLGMIQPSSVTYLTPSGSTPAGSGGTGVAPLGQRTVPAVVLPSQAPAGDANWPTVKSQLAGTP